MTLDELDRLAAEKIMGWEWRRSVLPEVNLTGYWLNGRFQGDLYWQPTRRIDHAFQLLEKFERYTVMTWEWTEESSESKYRAVVGVKGIGVPSEVWAETAPLAITRVCLKAVGALP